MFGYILPEKPELKIREYELFRAYYCGVCKSIGKRFGHIERMTLNYDSTFLALLLSSLSGEKTDIKKERCITHPFQKNCVIRDSALIDYAADMNIILAYYNLQDNLRDEKSVLSASVMLLLSSAFKKLKYNYYEKCGIIESRLNELSTLEKKKCDSIDMVAEPFAKIMEVVTACELLCNDEKTMKILRWIGYNIGKWIYIIDAFDDIEEDIKKKTYNPMLYHYKYVGGTINEFKSSIMPNVEFTLTYSLGQIAKAYELLEGKNNCGVIENIIYMGMLRKTENILKGSCKKVEKSV